MYENLRFRRQFLLAVRSIPELKDWNCLKIDKYHLYSHPDLMVTTEIRPSRSVILLGSIFDPYKPSRTNADIIYDISKCCLTFSDLLNALKMYFGRFVIIYRDDDVFNIRHDALGQKEIFYCLNPNNVICGSQPNLVDKYSSPNFGFTIDPVMQKFHKRDIWQARHGRLWVGDETYYQNVKHLLPNHYLNINTMSAIRYWPNCKLERIDLDSASTKICDHLKGAMKALTTRHEVMLAVTAGYDSRSLLAASKDVQNEVYFFINKEPRLSERSSDIVVARKIFKKIKRPFQVHKVSTYVDEDFQHIYFNNVFLATDFILPANYSVYFKNMQNKVNIAATGEIGRDYYGPVPKNLDGYFLARCMKFKNSLYAVTQCNKWLAEVRDTAEYYNVDILKLLFWEFVMGNWEALAHSEADIALEQFDPYNSHYLCEIMLSVGSIGDKLFRQIIRQMWPELLELPFNPPQTLKDHLKTLLQKAGLFIPLQRLLYKYDRYKYFRLTQKTI